MRVPLLRGGECAPLNCAQCGKRIIFGVVYSVKIDGEQFRVCSFECEKALKDSRKGETAA